MSCAFDIDKMSSTSPLFISGETCSEKADWTSSQNLNYPVLPPLRPHPTSTSSTGQSPTLPEEHHDPIYKQIEVDRSAMINSRDLKRNASFVLIFLVGILLLSGYFLRDYIQMVLLILEHQVS